MAGFGSIWQNRLGKAWNAASRVASWLILVGVEKTRHYEDAESEGQAHEVSNGIRAGNWDLEQRPSTLHCGKELAYTIMSTS